MDREEDWGVFCDRFIDATWFDLGRNKTLVAMRKIWERVPQHDLEKLPSFLIVFAPFTGNLGEVFPLALFDRNEAPRGVLIYLSPGLEKKRQEEVDSVVAHEFSHAVLGCYRSDYTSSSICPQGVELKNPGDRPSERDADALARRWGFKPAHKSNQG